MPAKNKPAHLLVIRLSAMGDVAMTVPVLGALLAEHPEIKLTVLTRPLFQSFFSHLPRTEVVCPDLKGEHKGMAGIYRLNKSLKPQGFTAVADLHNVLRSKILRTFFRFDGVPVAYIDKGRKEKKALVQGKIFRQLKTTHQRYADVFLQLGFKVDLGKYVAPAKSGLPLVEGLRSEKKLIGVAPFAQHIGKQYPLELMEEALNQLASKAICQIILFGGGGEEAQKLEQLAGRIPSAVSVAGKLKMPEELALISNLAVMLSMDSGNAHIAAMLGVPVVTIWGVTHPYAGFYPYGQPLENALLADRQLYPKIPTSVYGNKFPAGYDKAMETLRPEMVVDKLGRIFKNPSFSSL
jgi:ADP-heptose:LPS heptosyltransferase